MQDWPSVLLLLKVVAMKVLWVVLLLLVVVMNGPRIAVLVAVLVLGLSSGVQSGTLRCKGRTSGC